MFIDSCKSAAVSAQSIHSQKSCDIVSDKGYECTVAGICAELGYPPMQVQLTQQEWHA